MGCELFLPKAYATGHPSKSASANMTRELIGSVQELGGKRQRV